MWWLWLIVVIILVYWFWHNNTDANTGESFMMRYVPMSDSFYYMPPWGRRRMIWGPRHIPLRMYVYDPSRPFHMRNDE